MSKSQKKKDSIKYQTKIKKNRKNEYVQKKVYFKKKIATITSSKKVKLLFEQYISTKI